MLEQAATGGRSLAPGWTDYAKRIQYQTYDARLEMPGWATESFKATSWRSVKVEADHDLSLLWVAQVDPPVRMAEGLKPIGRTQPVPGSYLFDLGQNMVGWARLKVQGPAGTIVRLALARC